jgi:hypothetical protein
VKTAVSTPHGTIDTRSLARPSRRSSNTSSEQVASTWLTPAHSPRSSSTRWGGEVSAAPWCRLFTEPSAWKVCSTGTGGSRLPAASTAASPDIQKCAWTTSGRRTDQPARSSAAKAGMCPSSSSLGSGTGGPAVTWATS